MNRKHRIWIGLVFVGLLVISASFILFIRKPPTTTSFSTAIPQTGDRLAEPSLPANPTQFEWGRHLYWLNCMPCHGDRGQGLTEEFRGLWVADHQDCWARGCHAGHMEDQGFPIPRTVPAVISGTGTMPPFDTADSLFEYLQNTHPPQHPGYLPDDQYWAITNYLLVQNNRLSPGQEIGPGAQTSELDEFWRFTIAWVLFSLAVVILVWLVRVRKPVKPDTA